MININYGRNPELLKACKPLQEYAWLVKEIRENRKNNELDSAIDRSITNIPGDFIIRSFLLAHRAEVKGMLLTEYNEAEAMELFKEDGRREGRKEGRKEGRREGRTDQAIETAERMIAGGKLTFEDIAEYSGLSIEKVRELAGNMSA